jgi:poly(hydroxyalkanoate) depolymerase family esterase
MLAPVADRIADCTRGRMTVGLARRAVVPAAVISGWLVATPAQAASLSPAITGYTTASVPSYITMFEYVPPKLAANPPIVVAAHYCGGNASGMFGEASGIVSLSNQYGFLMIFPQTSNNCWDVGSTKSLTHDGGGDTQAIAEMVKYSISKHAADANRVYVMGVSSGAMMTEALLAVYPDVFKAGAEFSGVPAGCWAVNYSPSNQWSSPCAGGMVMKTPQQWGDLVRAMYPGYSGFRPRVQLWHGTSDMTINYNNMGEAIKEWTNVLGLSMTPTSTDTPMSGYSRETWQNSCGFTVLQAWTQQNGGHTTPIDASAVISFFGLDKTGPDPEEACGDGGAGGSSGTDASAGSGGSSGSGGGSRSGGSSGSSSSGGSGPATGSSGGNGPMSGSSGGSSGGNGGSSSGGVTGPSGGDGGPLDSAGSSGQPGSPSPGCSCDLTGGSTHGGAWAWTITALGLTWRRRSKGSPDTRPSPDAGASPSSAPRPLRQRPKR